MVRQYTVTYSGRESYGRQLGISILCFNPVGQHRPGSIQCLHHRLRTDVVLCLPQCHRSNPQTGSSILAGHFKMGQTHLLRGPDVRRSVNLQYHIPRLLPA